MADTSQHIAAPPHPPLVGWPLVIGSLALSLGNFVVVLDTTITNVAMPTISGALGVSTDEGTWIITAYAVAEAITVPLTGWLSRMFGEVHVFIVSMFAFVICSVLCGMSGSLESLILFRVLQGLAGGPLIPLSSSLMISIFPRNRSNVAVALWGLTTVVAPILGPILGGYISDNYPWGWIFYINIFFGAVVAGLSWVVLRNRETPINRTRIDAVGLVLLVAFVTPFQIMLDKGRDLDWFQSPFIVTTAILAAISVVLLVIWEVTDDEPALDLSVFLSRNWLVSTIVVCLMFGLFFGNIVLTPLWLQKMMGYTATWAGFAIAPMGILSVVTAPIVGRLLPKIDPRLIVTYGMIMLAVSFFMRMQFTTQVDFSAVAWAMFVLGAGLPACLVTLTALGVSDLAPDKVAGGLGLQNFLRVLSMAVGTSLTQTYWENATRYNRAELVGAIGSRPHIAPAGHLALFAKSVERQAVMLATNDFYAWATILMLLFACVIWLAERPRGPLRQAAH